MTSKESIEAHIIDFICKETLLDREEIEVDINLGALGVGSLAGIKLVGSLEEAYSVRVSPTLIFEHPTIQELAKAVLELTSEIQEEPQNV